MAPESGKQPPSKEGGAPIPPVTSVHPEAPDTLLEALRSASIVEELFSTANKASDTSSWTEVADGTGTPPPAEGGCPLDSGAV